MAQFKDRDGSAVLTVDEEGPVGVVLDVDEGGIGILAGSMSITIGPDDRERLAAVIAGPEASGAEALKCIARHIARHIAVLNSKEIEPLGIPSPVPEARLAVYRECFERFCPDEAEREKLLQHAREEQGEER